MPGREDEANRGEQRSPGPGPQSGPAARGSRQGRGAEAGPSSRGSTGAGKGPRAPRPKRTGGLSLRRLGGDDYELVHPRCVNEMELDYAEGIELWRAGDPEAARDALRYALQGCGDNIWVHVALGRIALEEFNDPALARGHFGYAFELAQRAIPPGFRGRIPRERMVNRPFYEAIDGLSACYDPLGKPEEVASLRNLTERLAGRGGTTLDPEPRDPARPRNDGRGSTPAS